MTLVLLQVEIQIINVILNDVIHKVLNDLTVDDWSIIIGGDSHTRMSKGVALAQILEL